MGKPYEQLKINTKKLNKANKADCADELTAFFTCMSVSVSKLLYRCDDAGKGVP